MQKIIEPYQTVLLKNEAIIKFYLDNEKREEIIKKHKFAQQKRHTQIRTGFTNFALFPGFAQTVINENPLFQQQLLNKTLKWGLDQGHQMITIETFVSIPKMISTEKISSYTYNDFQTLIDNCLETVYTNVQDYHILAHSTPTIPIILNFQNSIQAGKPIHSKSTTLFAPLPTSDKILQALVWKTKNEQLKLLLPLTHNLFGMIPSIEPKILSKIKHPLTFVCGTKDTKIAPSNISTAITEGAANPHIMQTYANQDHMFATTTKKYLLQLLKQIELHNTL